MWPIYNFDYVFDTELVKIVIDIMKRGEAVYWTILRQTNS